ncbi:uncharacterized protein BJ212DRAFT_1271651, partial [Suillus subaureus]
KISCGIKLTAVGLHEQNILSLEQILACVGFSESTFWQLIKLWCEPGDVIGHNYGPPGHPQVLTFNDVNYLLQLVNHCPNLFLIELQPSAKSFHTQEFLTKS